MTPIRREKMSSENLGQEQDNNQVINKVLNDSPEMEQYLKYKNSLCFKAYKEYEDFSAHSHC